MVAALTPGYSFGTTEQVTAAKLASLVSAAAVSGIDQTNLASGSGVVITSASQPSNTNAIWIDSGNSNTVKAYNGSAWVVIGAASTPVNYRSGMYVMQASTTTITIAPGLIEVNGLTITKTANSTLTISTAGDWAGGSSLRATSTKGHVLIDASGNFKLTTTAPGFADYALTYSAANNTKRYASVSGTVYRYIGWFYMNATGSGELDTYGVSNIADGNVKNIVSFQTGTSATGTTQVPVDDTIPQNTEGDQYMSLNFVPTNVNNEIRIEVQGIFASSGTPRFVMALFQDSTAGALMATINTLEAIGIERIFTLSTIMKSGTTSLTTFKIRGGGNTASTTTFNGDAGNRILGGVVNSFIRIEEIESQLT